jgi:hypothetical protein
MLRIINNRYFVGGLATGVVLCFLIFGAIFYTATNAAETALTASEGNRVALESCTAKLAEVNSHWTLLMDRPEGAMPAAQILNGLVSIGPGKAFTDSVAASPRWEVPAKVVPFVAGPRDRAVYYYWDPRTHDLDGPHVPEEVHGEKP